MLIEDANLILKAHESHRGVPYFANELVQPRGPLTIAQIADAYHQLESTGELKGTAFLICFVPNGKAPALRRIATKYILASATLSRTYPESRRPSGVCSP